MESVDSSSYRGIPVISLYGSNIESLKASASDLEDIDCVIYDIQDIGSRYYTYLATLSFMMEACEGAGIEVVVLDRPNPVNGMQIEGGLVEDSLKSFVGLHSVCTRHGMTAGEYALFLKKVKYNRLNLHVIKMEGFRRSMYFEDTGLLWIMPSPNMPAVDTAVVYPGMCLLEGTNLSEGRGTTRPFEIFGAPYVSDPDRLKNVLLDFHIEGALFRPLCFVPAFDKYKGQTCGGIQIHVTDRKIYKSLRTGISVLLAANRLYPDHFLFRTEPYEFVSDKLAIDLLLGKSHIREMIKQDHHIDKIMADLEKDREDYLQIRKDILIYE
jgi:uncharacterized protein YbbC (DUF1343 family)